MSSAFPDKHDDQSAAKPAKPKSARRRSRELALQGLYEWLVSGTDAGVIDAHMREQEGFDKADRAHFDALLHGCITEAADLDAVLAKLRLRRRRARALGQLEQFRWLPVPTRPTARWDEEQLRHDQARRRLVSGRRACCSR